MATDTDRMIPAQSVSEALSHLLGNGCRLLRISRMCAWNVRGEGAERAASLFAFQAGELWEGQDKLAKRIRALGSIVSPDDGDDVVVEQPSQIDFLRCTPRELCAILLEGHRNAMLSFGAAEDVALSVLDHVSVRVVRDRAARHARHIADLETLRAA